VRPAHHRPSIARRPEKQHSPLTRKFSPESAARSDIQKLNLDEKKFRWLFNEDTMAAEKTAEGIRLFNADAMKLEKYISERL
jgi:transaldolase